jgi:hypothetical protein
MTCDASELTAEGYELKIECACGGTFYARVTQEIADQDLLRSRLLACPN